MGFLRWIEEDYNEKGYCGLRAYRLLLAYISKVPARPIWNLDLTEYVRHQIHHPENRSNPHFTKEELKQSIEDMREYICNRAETEGICELIPDED